MTKNFRFNRPKIFAFRTIGHLKGEQHKKIQPDFVQVHQKVTQKVLIHTGQPSNRQTNKKGRKKHNHHKKFCIQSR